MTRKAAVLGTVLVLRCAVAAAESARRLSGTVPGALGGMARVGRAPADLRLEHVTVFLGLRDREGLDAVVAAQQERRSPRFRRWLEATEIADRFGPGRTEYERVRRWLAAQGLEIVHDSPYRVAVAVAGTAAQVASALRAPVGLFQQGDRIYRGPLAEPVLPADVGASVHGILGLDDLPRIRPLVLLPPGTLGCRAGHPCSALAPADFAAAYGLGPLRTAGLTGAGRSIAIVARSNFTDGDVADFAARFVGAPLRVRRVFAGSDPGILPEEGELTEVLLDTQWAGALAPGVQVNVVIGSRAGGIHEAVVKAVEDHAGDVVSISFGLCEPAALRVDTELLDAVYAIANAQGQTVLVASGDHGPSECAPSSSGFAVNALASSPHAVAVGGTSFPLDAWGNVTGPPEETVWNDESGMSGGGRSVVFGLPRYQLLAGLSGQSGGRALPDVALAASRFAPGYVVVQGGEARVIGGTSAGAPALAGMLALLNEQLARAQGSAGLGQLLPALYRLGREQSGGLGRAVFRDVVAGGNGGFDAGPGFDLATGWGAPLADALAAALEAPGRCEPEIDCLVPWRGGARRACAGEWLVERDAPTSRGGQPWVRQRCRDGDPRCDADGAADGHCTINVALCLNVFDHRTLQRRGPRRGLPRCEPGTVRDVRLLAPREGTRDTVTSENRRALLAALAALPDLPITLDAACTPTVPVVVPARGTGAPGRVRLRARVRHSSGTMVARVTLRCSPA